MKKYRGPLVLLFFIFLSLLLFRSVIFSRLVPFPANLLASFYAPWKYEVWDGYPNGPANKPIGFDNLKLFYPYRAFTVEQVRKGIIPLWNPYNFSGNVHLATYQAAVFYPLSIVYYILPLIDGWSVLVVMQPILSGFFMYLFLRSLKLSFRSSLFGGCVFSLSGWMVAWSQESLVIEHSALWLPLMLYSIQSLFNKKYLKGILFFVASLSFSILAGFLQMTLYSAIIAIIYFVYKFWHREKSIVHDKKKILVLFIVSLFVSFLLTGIHLVPSLESYFISPRGVVRASFVFSSYLMKPWHLITYLAPDFWGNPGSYNYFDHNGFYHEKVLFIGIPALLFVLYALLRKGDKTARLFKIIGVSSLLLGFFPFGWILYFSSLPLLSSMVPSRIFFVSMFCFSVLSAYGIEDLLNKKLDFHLFQSNMKKIAFVFISIWLFVAGTIFFDPKSNYVSVGIRNLVVPTFIFLLCVFLIFFAKRVHKKTGIFYLAFLCLSLFSSFYFAHKFLYFSERRFVFPQVPVLSKLQEIAGLNRVWGYGNGYMEKNMNTYYKLYSPEGYDALYPQWYGELLHTQESMGVMTDQIFRTDAVIRPAGERDAVLTNPFRARLLSLLGVKYIYESKKGEGKDWSTTDDRFPPSHFTHIWENETYRIWEYKDVYPRAFLVTDYVVEKDPQKAVDYIFGEPPPRERVVLSEKPIEKISPCPSIQTQADITVYEAQHVVVSTTSSCPSLLFLSDSYYPGWKATVDGAIVPIYRANYAFRAVYVSSGNHQVVFTYDPLSFKIGAILSMLGIAGLGVLLIFARRYEVSIV